MKSNKYYVIRNVFYAISFMAIYLITNVNVEASEGAAVKLAEESLQTITSSEPFADSNSLDVSSPPVFLTDIDMGEYVVEMVIDSFHLLKITPLPVTESKYNIFFDSSNKSVATINEIGRIHAISKGTTIISVVCQDIKRSFELTVIETTDKNIPIEDIFIDGFDEIMYVGDETRLNVSFMPINASANNLTFKIDNSKVAALSETGNLTILSPGQATITVIVNTFTKTFPFTAVSAAKRIVLDKNYIVLNPGEKHQIVADIFPEDATNKIRFVTKDNSIVSVNESGLVVANTIGKTGVTVINGELQQLVTIIVTSRQSKILSSDMPIDDDSELKIPVSQTEDFIIASSSKFITVNQPNLSTVTSLILQSLYEQKKELIIVSEKYSIGIGGSNIINTDNEFSSDIKFTYENNQCLFQINDSKPLPGEIHILFDKNSHHKKFLYKEDNITGKLIFLREIFMNEYNIFNIEGKYALLDKPLEQSLINDPLVILCLLTVVVGSCIMIVIRYRHVFW